MRYLSTGQAAKRLSVTPDTILKWIKQGRLPALKTVGGHYRISTERIESLLLAESKQAEHRERGPGRHFLHCWEYFAENGRVREGCQRCLVYQARAAKCYEMSKLPPGTGFEGIFCQTSCEECPYYKNQRRYPLKVLIITDMKQLDAFRGLNDNPRLKIEYTSCEYECSLLVDTFRPDFVIIDCAMPEETARELCHHLATDPRIPEAKIILAVPRTKRKTKPFPGIHSRIEHPFSGRELEEHLDRLMATQVEHTA